MAELYEVLSHSITVEDAKGVDSAGVERVGRHWLHGSVVELSMADAAVLMASKAVSVAKDLPKTSPVAHELTKKPAKPFATEPVKDSEPPPPVNAAKDVAKR